MTASSTSVGGSGTDDSETVRVRTWDDTNDTVTESDPDEVVTLPVGEAVLWEDDVAYANESLRIDIHPADAPATLEVYTSDSARSPSETFHEGCVDGEYWDGPIKYGLSYEHEHETPPSEIDVNGRVLFLVTTPLNTPEASE